MPEPEVVLVPTHAISALHKCTTGHPPTAITNFFARPGTCVSDVDSELDLEHGRVTIKGLATIDNVTLINVEVRFAGLKLLVELSIFQGM